MIEFTTPTGGKVAVNPMLVFAVEVSREGSIIISAAGGSIYVKESFEEVQRRVKGWTKSA